jgi:UBX domain-containing protein 1
MYLGDENTPSRSLGQSSTEATAGAASNRSEQVPLRFFSNGFTVGDGELRKFDDNKEFMEYIKRGEMPPELKSLSAGGRQVEVNDKNSENKFISYYILFQVRLEDHRGEEYKPVAPQFKPFGGAGHMLGSPAPNVTSSITTTGHSSATSTSSAASASIGSTDLEKLAEQRLKSSSSSTTIRLRLPDSSTPLRISIDLNRTLADVRKFLQENVPSLQSNQFEFIEPPSTKIKREDETKTISVAKLTNATLAIRRSS